MHAKRSEAKLSFETVELPPAERAIIEKYFEKRNDIKKATNLTRDG